MWIVHRWSSQCYILITVIGIYFVHDHVVFYEKHCRRSNLLLYLTVIPTPPPSFSPPPLILPLPTPVLPRGANGRAKKRVYNDLYTIVHVYTYVICIQNSQSSLNSQPGAIVLLFIDISCIWCKASVGVQWTGRSWTDTSCFACSLTTNTASILPTVQIISLLNHCVQPVHRLLILRQSCLLFR